MSACGSLQHIFDNPLYPPSPLSSCIHITSMKLLEDSPVNVLDSILIPDHNSTSSSQGLEIESFDDVKDFNDQWEERHENIIKHAKTKRGRNKRKDFPPPISSLGRRFCFKSYRSNGRLVVREEKMLTQDVLHAYREDGRLKMRFIRFDDDVEAKPDQRSKIL